jgi:ABC-type multidrug transport system ATPase subunit
MADHASPSLSWSSVSLTVDGRRILDGVTGEARTGRLLGIMGPSGAGKTSILQVLAGTVPNTRGSQLRGEMSGVNMNSGAREAAAFVGQDDRFHSQLSVSETLDFAAKLRLPSMSRFQRTRVVEELLRQLQLSHVRGTKVGDERCRGISGGERRRLALGCELVGRPTLIFADEPTSGLDAFQAERMMEALRDLSEQGHTVILSIHQPSSKIWRMLDDVMLVSEGRCCYMGPRDGCLNFFNKLGYR